MKLILSILIATAFAGPSSNRTITGQYLKNGAGILTIPVATDTLVGKATTDVFTNKSISGSTNTLTNIPNSAFTAGTIDFSKLVTVTGDISIATDGTSAFAGVVSIAKGGTNNASLSATAGKVVYADGSKLVTSAVGTSGDILTSGGSGAPTWTTTLPIANGGTNNAALAVTNGGVIYTDGSKAVNTGSGSSGQVLKSVGAGAPVWGSTAGSSVPTTIQTLTSGTTYNLDYYFTISSGNATLAATYTNNGVTFTVHATVASSTSVVMSGSGPPAASGTLTRTGGSGDATLTFSSYNAPVKLHIKMVGGGGGGAGGGTTNGVNQTAGGTTTFNTTLSCAGGGAGIGQIGSGGNGAAGGTCSAIPANAEGYIQPGERGTIGFHTSGSTAYARGGDGGASPFGGNGGGGSVSAGSAAIANTGSGGGGGSGSNAINNAGGGGGGSGGYLEAWIASPSATYGYAIGGAGTAGAAGTSGQVGAAGGSGLIIVEEVY